MSGIDRGSCFVTDGSLVAKVDGEASFKISPAIPTLSVIPTAEQAAWQEGEMYLFVHFGINTFTGRDWGDGREDPRTFRPKAVNAKQWARTAVAAGFKGLIFTAKHHDGYAMWPTKNSDFSVAQSPWQNGQGDVVKLVAEACTQFDLPFGVYVSLWDRQESSYGTPAYDDYFAGQLTELMTDYGPIFEVWLDSAHGENIDPKYNFRRYFDLIRSLQPQALIANAGPDIRWSGNELGYVDLARMSSVQGGKWYPNECDVPNRPGWFWRSSEDTKVKSLSMLLSMYFDCVGRNGVLLVNVPPNRNGEFEHWDVLRLLEFRKALDVIFSINLASGASVSSSNFRASFDGWAARLAADGLEETFWATDDDVHSAELVLDLAGCTRFNTIEIREPIQYGERIRSYRIEIAVEDGQWNTVATGSVVGRKRLHQIETVVASRVRLVVEDAEGSIAVEELGLYFNPF